MTAVTVIPVLVPPSSPLPSRPWVTPAMFRAFPTWLDTDNLIPGDLSAEQDDALSDALLTATDWAAGELGEMRLDAHVVTGEARRPPVNPAGICNMQPWDIPLRAVLSLSYGWCPTEMTALILPSQLLTTGPHGVSFRPSWWRRGPGRLYVNWSYVAGYPSALLPSGAGKGDNSVTVDEPAGILPGDQLRIYDPGASETLTVATTYAPVLPTIPPTATAVPLAVPVQHAHAPGTQVTGMPRKALQAVIAYGVALLMREDVSEEEPASPFGPAARTTAGARGGQASGLLNDAYGWLAPYRSIVRGP